MTASQRQNKTHLHFKLVPNGCPSGANQQPSCLPGKHGSVLAMVLVVREGAGISSRAAPVQCTMQLCHVQLKSGEVSLKLPDKCQDSCQAIGHGPCCC